MYMQLTNWASVCLCVCLHVHLAIVRVSIQREYTPWSGGGRILNPLGARLVDQCHGGWSLLDGCGGWSLVRMPLGARLVDEGGLISATYSPESQQPDVYVK